jgi:hypothetical protein
MILPLITWIPSQNNRMKYKFKHKNIKTLINWILIMNIIYIGTILLIIELTINIIKWGDKNSNRITKE